MTQSILLHRINGYSSQSVFGVSIMVPKSWILWERKLSEFIFKPPEGVFFHFIFLPGYGTLPLVASSVSSTPKDQTSDLMVKRPYRAASGAVHLIGNFAPAWRLEGAEGCTAAPAKRQSDGKRIVTLSCSVLVVFDESRQAKVGYFTHQAVSHQDVGGSQVSVDVVHPLHVSHACGNLGAGNERGLHLFCFFLERQIFAGVRRAAGTVVLPEKPCRLAEAGGASFLLLLSGNLISYLWRQHLHVYIWNLVCSQSN